VKHMYFTIRDKVAKKFVHVCESENAETMARMCKALERDEKTFIGQNPGDFVAYMCGYFDDETGTFEPVELEKVWEGKSNE
jgi:hypothetical protein